MDREERKQHLYDKTRELQKEAAKLNREMAREEHLEAERRLMEKFPRKEKTHYSVNLFDDVQRDNPQLLEDQVPDRVTQEQIIESGSPFSNALLVIGDNEARLKGKSILKDEDADRIIKSLKKSRDGYGEFLYYIHEYQKIGKFGDIMKLSFKVLQVDIAGAAVLIDQWYFYDVLARQCTEIYRKLKEAGKPEDFLKDVVETSISSHRMDGAVFTFDEEKEVYSVDVDGKGKLYETLLHRAASASEKMSHFKALVVALQTYSGREDRPNLIWPTTVDAIVDNAANEYFLTDILPDTCYMKSSINKKLKKHIPVTEEERKRAVMPDFMEVPVAKETYEYYLNYLEKL